ncbi:MAG TPA: protein kinase [Bryobacteraceae bacterium]|nr:protein kinase [Bryobacteraceae bacterium]
MRGWSTAKAWLYREPPAGRVMDSDRWRQVDSLLQAVLERPPEQRDEFLRRLCGGDEALEREVRSLLEAQQAAGSFLETPAIEVAAQAIAIEQNPETPETSGSLSGQAFSHYRVVEKLGVGGMGVVWKARDTRLDRFVALKLLPAARMNDPERKRRFVQEARTASALNHPNIVTIYEIDQAGPAGHSADFIAMEFVPGKTLDQLIAHKGLRLNDALQHAIQVADALAAAHAAGIVHRDLKPGNIMVSDAGAVKVLDFGLAKLTEHGSGEFARTETLTEGPLTDEGVIVGTAAYMSPEQAEGKKVDSRTDIFSFGAVLYEMLTGRRAFGGKSMLSILTAILRDEPTPAREIAQGLPRDLDRILTRCLQKDPGRRYQHAGDLKLDLQQVKEGPAAGDSAVPEAAPAKRSAVRRWWLVAAAACVAIAFAVGWWLHGPPAEPAPWVLTRLTADNGLSGSSALSPDGKLVAYSSDRSLDGARDLYVKQVAGGQPIRLTSDGAGNTMPDFSPDGSKIVFRSNRDGGGIYEIPAFGGDARLLARDGLNPKFSPDGSQVAYWVGAPEVAAAVPGSGTVWVVPVAGGQPQQVGTNFTAARFPIWSPDGKRLLLIGYTSAKAYEASGIDWWVVNLNGGEAVRTGEYEAMVRTRQRAVDSASNIASAIPNVPVPGCWLPAGNTVTFSITSGDTQNLWEVGISPRTGKLSGAFKRLSTGSGNEVGASCASGAITFTNIETRRNVWWLPIDLDRGASNGALERVTEGLAERQYPSLSSDGRYVAFASNQSGRLNIWRRDTAAGKESSVASSSFVQRFPVSNASGARIAYSSYEQDKRVVYVSAPGGAPEKLCEGCLRATDWSRDEKILIMFGGNPYQINLLDLASHQQTPLLKHATYNLLYGRFSPDNRWISFTARNQQNRGRITIAPVDGPKPVPESAWIAIAEEGLEDWANWSPDGKTLYFTSSRDGYACLWGQRLDAGSHRPAGDAFAVQHFHGRLTYAPEGGWSPGGGRIAMVLTEATGNIWMMSRSAAR